jgi:hypothetical protein
MKQVLLYLLLSILVHISSAYISDIKLVSCDASHACANYPGYLKLDTDLNKGVKDAPSVFMHIKEDPSQEPITDLMIMRGNDNATGIPHFNKWKKLKLDLNEGTDHPLYLLYTKDTSISNNPVTSIIVKEGSSPVVGAEYKRIEVDLNQDVGGYHLFMYYSQDGIKGMCCRGLWPHHFAYLSHDRSNYLDYCQRVLYR